MSHDLKSGMMNGLKIRRAAVLGAGVMGAQIAGLLANAGLEVLLLDRPDADGTDSIAAQALDLIQQGRSPALYDPALAARIKTGTFENLAPLSQVDWIVEAVVEDLEAKRQLYGQIETHLAPHTVLSTNTSGLSIEVLAASLAASVRQRFLGVHFFNPPRHMKLVEVVPHKKSDADLVAAMVNWLAEDLGKGVVLGRDTPNFIANRVGVFAIMDVLHRMGDRSVEQVDALTGSLIGRPRSATLRLCDIIGLDTLAKVSRTAFDNLAEDPWRSRFALPGRVGQMIEAGQLGLKVQGGFYRKGIDSIEALQPDGSSYAPLLEVGLGDLAPTAKVKNWQERLRLIWQTPGTEADFIRQHLLEVLLYAAYHAEEIAETPEAIDQAMRWGFNWQAGPFQIWDAVGMDAVLAAAAQAKLPVPQWVLSKGGALDKNSSKLLYNQDGTINLPGALKRSVNKAPVQHDVLDPAQALDQVDGAYLLQAKEGVGIVVLRGKLNILGQPTLEFLDRAFDNPDLGALVICGSGGNFSAGADLKYMAGLVEAQRWDELEHFVRRFQQTAMHLAHAVKPVVVAAQGLVLGGGCEFCLASTARVFAAESRIGLVETQVGLVPGGGGCKEMVRAYPDKLDQVLTVLLAGKISDNAYQARSQGLVGEGDVIVLNAARIVDIALEKALALMAQSSATESGPIEGLRDGSQLTVSGDDAFETLKLQIDAQAGLSEHDRYIGHKLAHVLSGGGGGTSAGRSVAYP
jgi:3-hydroxyacyl-CoA dehydrogenase